MSINKAMLVGRLTKDAELKYFSAGDRDRDRQRSVLHFTLAVQRDYPGADGEKATDFIPISYFNDNAEAVLQYLVKGRLLAVTGRLQVSSYTNSEGAKRYMTQIIADEIQFLDSWKVDTDNAV